jgi:hypothetical protein
MREKQNKKQTNANKLSVIGTPMPTCICIGRYGLAVWRLIDVGCTDVTKQYKSVYVPCTTSVCLEPAGDNSRANGQ